MQGADLGLGRVDGGIAGFQARLLLVEQLPAGVVTAEQFGGALEFLAGQVMFAEAQLHIGFGCRQGLFGPQHFGFGLGAAGFQGAGVEACE